MSFIVQSTFDKYQSKGQVGQVSRASLPFTLDSNGYVAFEKLKPSYGVYKEAGGKYAKPTDLDTQARVMGVVHGRTADINSNNGSIVISPNEEFEIMTQGHMYVELSENVLKGDMAFPDVAGNGGWLTAVPTGAISNPITFEESGSAGEIVSIRINGQISA